MAEKKKGMNLEQTKDDGAQLAQMMQELSDTQRHPAARGQGHHHWHEPDDGSTRRSVRKGEYCK